MSYYRFFSRVFYIDFLSSQLNQRKYRRPWVEHFVIDFVCNASPHHMGRKKKKKKVPLFFIVLRLVFSRSSLLVLLSSFSLLFFA